MENVNFTVIGQFRGLLLVVHKEDYSKLLKKGGAITYIKGIKITLKENKFEGPQMVGEWLKFIPFDEVNEEAQPLILLVINKDLSDTVIGELIEAVEKIKFKDNE